MNIVFMIGNGFDLNLGLRTRFTDFCNFYSRIRAKDSRPYMRMFLDEIGNKSEEWSNFEMAFGRYAKNFSAENYENYLDIWSDVILMLTKYINLQQKNAIPAGWQPNDNMFRYLMFPNRFLAAGARPPFEKMRDRIGTPVNIDVINFNYTNTFEKLYGWRNVAGVISDGQCRASFNSVTHIHGTTQENMILGVDNLSQLACIDSLRSQEKMQNRLIKPVANKNSLTLRDRYCAERIAKANIICIFGMSLGETDRTWWRLVGERLQNPDVMAIIFSRNKGIPMNLGYLAVELQDAKIKEFLRIAGLSDSQIPGVMSKIRVAFNSEIFSHCTNIASTRSE